MKTNEKIEPRLDELLAQWTCQVVPDWKKGERAKIIKSKLKQKGWPHISQQAYQEIISAPDERHVRRQAVSILLNSLDDEQIRLIKAQPELYRVALIKGIIAFLEEDENNRGFLSTFINEKIKVLEGQLQNKASILKDKEFISDKALRQEVANFIETNALSFLEKTQETVEAFNEYLQKITELLIAEKSIGRQPAENYQSSIKSVLNNQGLFSQRKRKHLDFFLERIIFLIDKSVEEAISDIKKNKTAAELETFIPVFQKAKENAIEEITLFQERISEGFILKSEKEVMTELDKVISKVKSNMDVLPESYKYKFENALVKFIGIFSSSYAVEKRKYYIENAQNSTDRLLHNKMLLTM